MFPKITVFSPCSNDPWSHAGIWIAKYFKDIGILDRLFVRGGCKLSTEHVDGLSVVSDLRKVVIASTHTLFTFPVKPPILHLLQQCGIWTFLLFSPEWLEHSHIEMLHTFDAVICPFMQHFQLLRDDWKLTNLVYIPQTFNLPVISKPDLNEPSKVKAAIVFPSGISDEDVEIGLQVDTLLQSHKKLVKTELLSFSSKTKKLTTEHSNHLSLRAINEHKYDLIINPMADDYFGLITVQSRAAGLPVIGRATTGNSELIDDRSGIMITEPETEEDNAVDGLVSAVFNILSSKNEFRKIRREASNSLRELNSDFIDGWKDLVIDA